MDVLLVNGNVITMDPRKRWAQALLVRDRRIEFVGATDEALQCGATGCEVVDLGGKTVMPGFIDSHMHGFLTAIMVNRGVHLETARTVDDVCQRIRAQALKTPPGAWVHGFGCIPWRCRENRFPTMAELDYGFQWPPRLHQRRHLPFGRH